MFVALLALSVGQADAQRCLPKMKGIELKANMADGFHTSDKDNSAGYSFGAALSSYAKGGHKWVFGAEYLQWHSPYKDIRIPAFDIDHLPVNILDLFYRRSARTYNRCCAYYTITYRLCQRTSQSDTVFFFPALDMYFTTFPRQKSSPHASITFMAS